MADDKTKSEKGDEPRVESGSNVDPESVKVEDMELSEQQLRMVSGGKGLGRALRAIGGVAGRMGGMRDQDERPDVLRISPTVAQ